MAPASRSRALHAVEVPISILVYSMCSISMILLNKVLMNIYGLPYPNCLLLAQNAGSVVLVTGARQMGFLTFPFSMEVARRWLPLTVLFVGMLYTSMKSLNTMSVSVQTIIKNLAVIGTAMGDAYLYKKPVSRGMYFSFGLMIFGSYLGAKGDPWVTVWGIIWTFANIFTTVGYTLYIKRLQDAFGEQIGRYGPVFYSNFLSLPFLLIGASGEVSGFTRALSGATFGAWFFFLVVIAVGSCMTFAVFWCMKMTSPTTFSVVGSLNKVPLTFLGMVVFSQFPDFIGYIGVAVALGGGFVYTYYNLQAQQKAALARARNSRLDQLKDNA